MQNDLDGFKLIGIIMHGGGINPSAFIRADEYPVDCGTYTLLYTI